MYRKRIPWKYSVCVIWLSGLVLGILFAHSSKTLIAPNIRGDIFMPEASFASVMLSASVPVIIAGFLTGFHRKWPWVFFLSVRAVVYGYGVFMIPYGQHGSGIFLLEIHLLSSSYSSAIVVYLSLCDPSIEGKSMSKLFTLLGLSLLLVCLFDWLLSGMYFSIY